MKDGNSLIGRRVIVLKDVFNPSDGYCLVCQNEKAYVNSIKNGWIFIELADGDEVAVKPDEVELYDDN